MRLDLDLEKLLKYAEKMGASEAELSASVTDKYVFEISKDSLERALSTTTIGFGIRVAVGKKIGAAGGEITGEEGALEIIRHAIKIAKSTREDEKWPGFNPKIGKAPVEVPVYSEETASLTEEEGVKILQGQLKLVKESDPSITVAGAGFRVSRSYSEFINSYGGPLGEKSTSYSYVLELKKKTGEGEGTYIDWKMGVKLDVEGIEETTQRAISRVSDAVKASPIEGFRGTLILDDAEAASLLRILIVPAISADNVQQRRSPLAGRLGEKVLSEKINIIDDPFLPYETGSAEFDDEGHPTSKKNVFEKGVLATYLYDHYTASIEGRESTGNGFKSAHHAPPSPSPSNLVLESTVHKEKLEDAIGEVEKGLYVVSTIGSWLSNPVSGQINATVTLGYLIVGGEIQKPVKGVAISGNIYEALADSFQYTAGLRRCLFGVCSSSIVVSDFTIAGH
ncbi:MAG: TldD/PmbA family protein [Desulfurococcales archaeon]|nr:TldD/PmbA family protein [Desulfurococcales archaeon]